MNEGLLDIVNGAAGHWQALDGAARFMAGDGLYALAGLLAVLGLLELRRDFRRGLRIGLAAALALGVTALLIAAAGHVRYEDRPFLSDADTVRLIPHAADNGFPSDHAAAAAAIAVVGALAWRRWAPVLLAWAALIGAARVFVGVHLPDDVAAGWAMGGAAALGAWMVAGPVMAVLPAPLRRPT